jgi:hypothetical protein
MWMVLLAKVLEFRDYDFKPLLGDKRILFLKHDTFADCHRPPCDIV